MKSARQYNVQILVKNHPLSFLYRSDDLVTFFDSYGWDRIVLGYDFANGYFGKEDPLVALANLTGRLGVVYAADTTLDDFQHAVVGTGAVRFAEVAQALREQQYSGPTVLEIVSQAPDESIDKSVAYLENVNWPTRPR
jgi:sugar phosphate isomerase/epimerase